jgi:excisionase family DNA binding protein
MNGEGFLSARQVEERLKISKATLRKLVSTGKIKAIIVSSRGDKRFSEEEIERFIKENTI